MIYEAPCQIGRKIHRSVLGCSPPADLRQSSLTRVDHFHSLPRENLPRHPSVQFKASRAEPGALRCARADRTSPITHARSRGGRRMRESVPQIARCRYDADPIGSSRTRADFKYISPLVYANFAGIGRRVGARLQYAPFSPSPSSHLEHDWFVSLIIVTYLPGYFALILISADAFRACVYLTGVFSVVRLYDVHTLQRYVR